MDATTTWGMRIFQGVTAVVFFAFLAASAMAEPVRYHGIQLNERQKLMVEERGDQLLVFLAGRDRVAGGPLKQETPDGGVETTYRVTDREVLFRVRSQIMRAAAPNYLSNPGSHYRIIVEGVELDPNLRVMHEVPADQVRDVLAGEIAKMGARADGIYREAMHYAAPLVLGVLKASGKLPPEIPTTIERSTVGRIRGLEEGLERKSLPAGRELNPLDPSEESEKPERAFTFDVAPADEGIKKTAPGAEPISTAESQGTGGR